MDVEIEILKVAEFLKVHEWGKVYLISNLGLLRNDNFTVMMFLSMK